MISNPRLITENNAPGDSTTFSRTWSRRSAHTHQNLQNFSHMIHFFEFECRPTMRNSSTARSSHGSSEIYVRGCNWASADHSPCRGCTCGTDCRRRARVPVLPWLPRWTTAASAGRRRSAADWGSPPPCRSSHSSSQSPLWQPLPRAFVSGTATSAPGSSTTTPSNPFPPEPPHAHSRAPEPPAPSAHPMPPSPFKTQHSLRSLARSLALPPNP